MFLDLCQPIFELVYHRCFPASEYRTGLGPAGDNGATRHNLNRAVGPRTLTFDSFSVPHLVRVLAVALAAIGFFGIANTTSHVLNEQACGRTVAPSDMPCDDQFCLSLKASPCPNWPLTDAGPFLGR